MRLCVCVQVCVYLCLSVCTYVFTNVSFVYMYTGVSVHVFGGPEVKDYICIYL